MVIFSRKLRFIFTISLSKLEKPREKLNSEKNSCSDSYNAEAQSNQLSTK